MMDLFDGIKGALRRWYVLVPILILTAVVALVVNGKKTTQYSSSASVGITTNSTSTQAPVPSGQPTIARNNALVQNGGVNLIANLMSIGLGQAGVQRQVVAAGGTLNYSVVVEQRGPSDVQLPIVDITATGKTRAAVAATMTILTGQATTTLGTIQANAGVPTDKYVKSFSVRPATTPARAVLSTTRNVGVVAVVGVIVAFVIAGVLDNLLTRGRSRHGYRSRSTAGDTDTGATSDENSAGQDLTSL